MMLPFGVAGNQYGQVDPTHFFANRTAAEEAASAFAVIDVNAQSAAAANAVSASPDALAAAQQAANAGGAIRQAAQVASQAVGATVATVAQAAAQAAAVVAAPVRLRHFFPESAVDMLQRQLQSLRDPGGGGHSATWTALRQRCRGQMP
jgi:hypothetical protein